MDRGNWRQKARYVYERERPRLSTGHYALILVLALIMTVGAPWWASFGSAFLTVYGVKELRQGNL